MSHASSTTPAWTAATTLRVGYWLGLVADDDVSLDDWPAAMSDPSRIDAALVAYDRPDARDDDRALLADWLLATFEFGGLELAGNADWRRTLDRLERDIPLNRSMLQRWADPEDGNPWLVSADLVALLSRNPPATRG